MVPIHFRNEETCSDLESQEYETFSQNLRNGFIRRVYGLVLLKLFVDILFCGSVSLIKSLKRILEDNSVMVRCSLFGLILITMCIYFAGYFNPELFTKYPINIIIFSLLTVIEASLLSALCIVSNPRHILMALSITAICVLFLTIYSIQTKYDFTSYMLILLYFSIALTVVSFIYLFFPRTKTVELVLAPIGALFASFSLVVTTQAIVGKGKYYIYEDSYVTAALLLYSEIIDLFVYILRIIMAIDD